MSLMTRIAMALVLVFTGFVAVAPDAAAAPSKRGPASALCVDVVRLKSGKTMRGAVLHQSVDGSLTMAVSREWLQKTYPDVYQQQVDDQSTVERQAWEQLRDRLKKEL